MPQIRPNSVSALASTPFPSYVSREAKSVLVAAVCVSVCLSVCLSLAALPYYCTDPDVNWGNGTGAHVVHYWADF